ncbi:NlpC/P60 family N-terminal domain-containing protein [Nitratifractor salsuginis]|uniref:NLP/P60 protein n=1 Tax=Nitratifractor salsuginis (strain DSM 16511 / JCM 12458 / E9I37-1) TaxID=749222 RepID=E6X2B6_NITSE|nr:NlpC/P60 family N-terminal domain-containing protein [Nitratifractor salsuginis]ADV46051.1 NLP/P60 protein [Nitratifractor salsuginis DSM 16511]
MIQALWLCLLPLWLLASWHLEPGKRPRSAIDRLPFKSVRDMRTIPQNPAYYARQLRPMSRSRQLAYDREYNRIYFSPWEPGYRIEEPKEELLWATPFVLKRKLYDTRKRLIPMKRRQAWVRNAQMEKLGSVGARAISVRHTDLRALPTRTPAYRDPWKSTEGFPFDYLQNSELHLNVPLYLSHYSKDGRWAFVQAAHANGWVPVKDIALVNERFIKAFKTGRYYLTTKDDLWLKEGKKRYSLIKMSTLFPLDRSGRWLLFARRGARGQALLTRIRRPSKKLIALKPLRFTPRNVARIARELYGEPYGWGGKMMTRDCSATTRDFFAEFGIFLKRNSAKQVKAGHATKIKGLPATQKKAAILRYAKPFRSMLYVPGHITLYLGKYRGEPVIMHTYWGIRQKDWSKYPLCRTIITTTHPGDELPNTRKKSELINTLQQIITF